jgi:hypothetical protein
MPGRHLANTYPYPGSEAARTWRVWRVARVVVACAGLVLAGVVLPRGSSWG